MTTIVRGNDTAAPFVAVGAVGRLTNAIHDGFCPARACLGGDTGHGVAASLTPAGSRCCTDKPTARAHMKHCYK